MTMGGYDTCEGSKYKEKDLVSDMIPLMIIFPCQLCFAIHFLRKLYQFIEFDSENTMVIATVLYILVSLSATAFALGNEIIEPMIQTKYNPNMIVCRTCRWFSWFVAGMAYWFLLEIFIARLSTVFATSPYRVRPEVRLAFRAILSVTAITAGVLFAIRSVLMKCWQRRSLGFLGRTPIFPSKVYFCNVEENHLWLRMVASGIVLMVFSVSIMVLLWMFIWRLRKIDAMVAEFGIGSDQGFGNLIQKSTMIALFGLLSTVTALFVIGVSGYISVVYFDFLLNNILIYCLFQFGEDLYQTLFGCVIECFYHSEEIDPNETRPLSYKSSVTASSAGHEEFAAATPEIDENYQST